MWMLFTLFRKISQNVPMNMNVSKTNGVKLLAAVMVMAMVFAGAAVVLSDSEVSAEPTIDGTTATVSTYADFMTAMNNGEVETIIINGNITLAADDAASKTTTISKNVTLNRGCTLTIPADQKLVIADQGSLKAAGNVIVRGTLDVQNRAGILTDTTNDLGKYTVYAGATVTYGGNFIGSEGPMNLTTGSLTVSNVRTDGFDATINGNGTITGVGYTIQTNSSITIADGRTVTIDSTLTVTGALTVLGTVTTTDPDSAGSITGAGTIAVGPNAVFDGVAIPTNATNVSDGNTYKIGGTLEGNTTVNNAILEDDLVIPSGMTLTVTGNLGMNGNSITVNGTLEIASSGSLYTTGVPATATTNAVILGANGTINNSGSIGKNAGVMFVSSADDTSNAVVQGVSGAEFGISDKKLTVTGTIAPISSAAGVKSITLTNAIITGDMTISNGATLAIVGDAVSMKSSSTLNVNGTLTSDAAATLNIDNGCSVTINGYVGKNITLTVKTGKVGTGSVVTSSTDVDVNFTPVDGTDYTRYVTGLTISVGRVTLVEDGDNVIYQRAYISGTLVASATGTVPTTGAGTPAVKITNPVYVAADDSVIVPSSVSFSADMVYVSGQIQISGTSGITDYEGAKYVITTTGTDASVTTYYTTFANALEAIDTADQKTIEVKIPEITTSFTVAEGQTVNMAYESDEGQYVKINEDAVVTVSNGGTITGFVGTVEGMLVKAPSGNTVIPDSYATVSTAEDGTVTYSGLGPAIANAQPGSTINIESAETSGSLSIPADVTVVVSDSLRIGGNLTVAAGATLQGGSIIFVKETDGSSTGRITVNGTFDLSDGSISVEGEKTMTLSTPGSTIGNITGITGIDVAGAQYPDADGNTVTTSAANAAAYAAENEVQTITLVGILTEGADIQLDGTDLVINGTVTLGTITINDAQVSVSSGSLTATVAGLNGTGDAAAQSAVALVKSGSTVASTVTVNADATNEYVFGIATISGEVTVSSGTVVLTASAAVSGTDNKLTVASGAVLEISESNVILTISNDNVVIDGTLDVAGGDVAYTGGTLTVNGTMDISDGGEVNVTAGAVSKLVINGTVNVAAQDNYDNVLSVGNYGVILVGTESNSVGATGAIVGNVATTGAGFIIAYPGTDVSAMVIDPVNGESTADSTEFYINDALYMTAYKGQNSTASLKNAIDTPEFDFKGYEVPTGESIRNVADWTVADGTDAKEGAIGSVEAVYFQVDPVEVTITVSSGSGISLYVDGVRVTSNTMTLTVGTHNVSATVNPGYTGEFTITLNGEAVTGGTITVTADMTTTNTVLSATGDISYDTGATGGDDGMGLTEILLVILVILIVVMAIMVALRLMRS